MHVALFATCLVDLFRPSTGFAVIKLLEDAGCQVDVPVLQTCCGQPAYNNGDLIDARRIAQQVIESLEGYPYVIVPSGSCAGMMINHYPQLFEDEPTWQAKAKNLAGRCYELVQFLHDVLNAKSFAVKHQGSVTYHDSCSSLREVRTKLQTRNLLNSINGINIKEISEADVCCGFGGTFSVKFPEISAHMVNEKVDHIEATGAELLLSGDLGCLLNIAGRLKRLNKPIKIFHIAEFLAGMTDHSGIGDTAGNNNDENKTVT